VLDEKLDDQIPRRNRRSADAEPGPIECREWMEGVFLTYSFLPSFAKLRLVTRTQLISLFGPADKPPS
jgi:hypothetical protein